MKEKKAGKSEESGEVSVSMKAMSLWSAPLVFIKNPFHSEIKKELTEFILEQEEKQNREIEMGIAAITKYKISEGRWDFLNEPNEAVHRLSDFFASTINVLSQLNQNHWDLENYHPVLEYDSAWYHVTRKGGFEYEHHHPNSSWSGIYYVDVGDVVKDANIPSMLGELIPLAMGGATCFYNPVKPSYIDPGSSFLLKQGTIETFPQDGLLLFFPSWMPHAVQPYDGDKKPRITVEFNVRVGLEPKEETGESGK
jgi:hypothetical protein